MSKQNPKVAPIFDPATQILVGNIVLPINPNPSPYVPTNSNLVNSVSELQTVALGAEKNLPVLLIGETGTGKTSFIRHLAQLTQNSFRRLNLNGGTTNDEIKGHYVVDDKAKGMRWVDGVLTEAMKMGYWLLLDEINACLPEITFTLHSVLDDDKMLVLEEHEGEIIRPHPNFRVFATMNPSMEYSGTKDLNKALLSRFPIVLQTQYPDPIHEIAIIKAHIPTCADADLALMVRVAEGIRQGKEAGTISFICSTRELINWANLRQSMPMRDAAQLAVLNKCELQTDKRTVEDIFKMHFGKWESKKAGTLKELEEQVKNADIVVQRANQERDLAIGQVTALQESNQRMTAELEKLNDIKQLADTLNTKKSK